MGRKKISEEQSKQIAQMKNEDKDFEEIAKILGLKLGGVKNHYYKKIFKNTNRVHISSTKNHCSDRGFHPNKLPWVTKTLVKHLDKYDASLIIGNQHCEDIAEIIKEEGKYIFSVDDTPERCKKNEITESFNADCLTPGFKTYLDGIQSRYPKCSAYINLNGKKDLIEEIFNRKFYPIVAIVSARGKKSKNESSLAYCKRQGAQIRFLDSGVALAMFY